MERWWWVSLCVCMYVQVQWVSEWVSEWVGGWVSEWMTEWVSEWVSECVSDCHACHAKAAETQGTPGRTSEPLAVSAHCATPATQKRRRPKGRQGVHSSPWQCTLCHACHAKEAETQGTPGRTSEPLAVHIVPRLPCKRGGDPRDARVSLAVHIVPRLPRKRGGDPRDARAYIQPLGSAHCPTPATQEAETQGTPGRTSEPWAVHIVPRLPRKRGGDPRGARVYIRALGSAHCATPATPKRRRPKGRQGVHPSPWQCTLCHACHAKEAETQGTPGRTSEPLAVHIGPRLPRQRGGDPRDARAYIRALDSAHKPATQKRRRPKGRQGVHPIPWRCTLSHACHAKEAETQGTPGRTSEPLAVHIVPRLPRQRGGDPRDARAYIRALGSAHCATPATQKKRRPKGRQGVHPSPATQKRRRPKGRQGVHPSPWQCTLSHVMSEWVSDCEWVSEWVWEWEWEWEWEWVWVWVWVWVSEWVSVWVSEWVSVSVSEWVSECVWVSEWVSEWASEWASERVWVSVSECEWGRWVSEWVSEREWVSVSECVSEWVSEEEQAEEEEEQEEEADTELKTKTPHVNVGNNPYQSMMSDVYFSIPPFYWASAAGHISMSGCISHAKVPLFVLMPSKSKANSSAPGWFKIFKTHLFQF